MVQIIIYKIKTFSALLALCEGNPPVNGGFPSQRASKAENVCLMCASKTVKQTVKIPVIWDAIPFIVTSLMYNVKQATLMWCAVWGSCIIPQIDVRGTAYMRYHIVSDILCVTGMIGIFFIHLLSDYYWRKDTTWEMMKYIFNSSCQSLLIFREIYIYKRKLS